MGYILAFIIMKITVALIRVIPDVLTAFQDYPKPSYRELAEINKKARREPAHVIEDLGDYEPNMEKLWIE